MPTSSAVLGSGGGGLFVTQQATAMSAIRLGLAAPMLQPPAASQTGRRRHTLSQTYCMNQQVTGAPLHTVFAAAPAWPQPPIRP